MWFFWLIASRLLWLIPTLLGLIVLTFTISHIIPADPAGLIAGDSANPAQVAVIRKQLGLDRPFHVQLGDYVSQLAEGNLGKSFLTSRPIADDLRRRLPATVELAGAAAALALFLGVPLGVAAAIFRNGFVDHAIRFISVAGIAIAGFWLALMLQMIFSVSVRWLPLSGRFTGFPPDGPTGLYTVDALLAGNLNDFANAAGHLTLPAIALGTGALATIVRFTRSGVLDALRSNFVLYQTAMGFSPSLTIGKYVLRNAMISVVTQFGLTVGILLAGSVVIETIFGWPGVGNYAYNAIVQSDYNALMGFTIWAGIAFTVINTIVDVIHAVIDPRGRQP